ncbi:TIM barrel protein [uncultured Propionibacterium sp.]|uniref:TIM barrel protein n=1 Tax=uncultured Propionibacterium sp. TaxID=218066 RepID=UPI0029309CA4|nr:TIM barrel protein [uncultured Propionibacterium sp.]
MSTLTLAACAEMIHTDLPFVERVEKIAARGLQVEIWDWTAKDLKALAATGAAFSSMTGYISGNLTDDDAIGEFLDSARRSVEAAEVIDSPRLNVHGTGLDGEGHPVRPVQVVTPDMWLRARDTLARLAEIGRQAGRVFTLENLNLPVDHAGTPFALARDTRALVRAVDSPHLRMNLDLYHCQIGEGNLIETCRESLPWIGEIQVADVPGRCQPGTGEINYAGVARGLHRMGYDGVVAMEAFASGDSGAALDDFVAAFSAEART